MEEKDVILKVENVSKQYRLGIVGTGTISHDLNRFWAIIRGKEDPYLKIGDANDRSSKGESAYVWALKDINFDVIKGEVLGIIGKNGAGKSTLLKILSKVTGPTTGSIKSKGRIASLLEVGTGFHPEMTGKENIFLNGAILGMTKKEINSKLEEIINFSGCERYIDTPVKRYSSGMKVRLAFAVAAFLEPDILVVDEVLAVGDAEFQKKAIGKMQDISNADGRTVLFVSHDMVAIQNLCDNTVVLDNGTVTFIGKTNEAIHKYRTLIDDVEFNKGVVNLVERKKYLDSTNFRLTSLKVFCSENGQGNSIATYGKGFFEIFYKKINNNYQKDYKVEAAIIFKDVLDNPILTFSTTFRKKVIEKNENDELSLKCSFSELNLAPGKYTIHIWFCFNLTDKIVIDNSCNIDVVENDIYGSGVLPVPKHHGNIITDKFLWE